jgi:hypothetical protein
MARGGRKSTITDREHPVECEIAAARSRFPDGNDRKKNKNKGKNNSKGKSNRGSFAPLRMTALVG